MARRRFGAVPAGARPVVALSGFRFERTPEGDEMGLFGRKEPSPPDGALTMRTAQQAQQLDRLVVS